MAQKMFRRSPKFQFWEIVWLQLPGADDRQKCHISGMLFAMCNEIPDLPSKRRTWSYQVSYEKGGRDFQFIVPETQPEKLYALRRS